MPPAAERPVRLRFVHTRYGHWGGRSGYPRFIPHLDAQGFCTQTHASGDNHDEIAPLLRPLRPWLRARLKRRPMPWYKVSDLNAELLAFRGCLAGRLDVIHFLDGEHGAQFLPRWLARIRSKARTVASFHQPPGLLEQLLDPALLPLFDHVVLMSPSQRTFFERHVAPERISVILHGVDTDFFHPAAGARRPGPLRCITAGHWLRDWRLFRAAAERLPSAEFHVVSGRETGAEHLPNVHRHVGVDDDALAALYRSADVLFLPLEDSTANNALLEGMASGLATVSTDLAGVRAYLPGDKALLAPAHDVEAAVAALRSLEQEPARRQALGAAARARAAELSWPKVASCYEALYAELAGRG